MDPGHAHFVLGPDVLMGIIAGVAALVGWLIALSYVVGKKTIKVKTLWADRYSWKKCLYTDTGKMIYATAIELDSLEDRISGDEGVYMRKEEHENFCRISQLETARAIDHASKEIMEQVTTLVEKTTVRLSDQLEKMNRVLERHIISSRVGGRRRTDPPAKEKR